jgi:hypothetical protein
VSARGPSDAPTEGGAEERDREDAERGGDRTALRSCRSFRDSLDHAIIFAARATLQRACVASRAGAPASP